MPIHILQTFILGTLYKGVYQGGLNMAENKQKQRFMGIPVENHDTAPWANIRKTKTVSRVTQPDETEVINAKEWVDANQK